MSEENKQNSIEEVLKLCEEKRDEYLNGWKRAKADLENYKKDMEKEREMIAKFSNEMIIRDLISVMDSFDLAIEAEKDNEGLKLIRGQLEGMLERQGLKSIKAVGEKFDPGQHESIGEEESDKEIGTVLKEIERGWRLYDRVLRPARVKIAK